MGWATFWVILSETHLVTQMHATMRTWHAFLTVLISLSSLTAMMVPMALVTSAVSNLNLDKWARQASKKAPDNLESCEE
jgi:hypothetical protein